MNVFAGFTPGYVSPTGYSKIQRDNIDNEVGQVLIK